MGDDAKTGLKVIKKTNGKLTSVTGDAAYDTVAIYDQVGARGARVVVPPTRSASVSGGKPRSAERDQTIRRVAQVGRRRWKKESGYHRQWPSGEHVLRFKTIIGGRLRARSWPAQEAEAAVACNMLNRMSELGWLKSVKVVG